GRAFEQIRNSICYPNLNVKICASHSGITVGEDGASHQTVEDISLMRSIPNMKVFQPCDAKEAEAIVKAVATIEGPCYVRLGRPGVEEVYKDEYTFEYGKGVVLHQGSKVAIIATGLMVQESLKAKEMLNDLDPTIINIHTIKPIDKELISEVAKTHDVIVTVEEHSVIGGLGSAVAEVLAPLGLPCKQFMIGMQDEFGRSGTPAALLEYYKLDAKHIAQYINNLK
ncbi:MAG: transketolase family protein, partial [Erysipelotrichia bacterium]|nr:transketolase family protein [Erysipelotrichia bacterium]